MPDVGVTVPPADGLAAVVSYSHNAVASSNAAAAPSPSNNFWANGPQLYVATPLNSNLAGNAIGNAGAGQAHENRSPYLVINFIIALTGIFPSRS